jgi:hypothetical protein
MASKADRERRRRAKLIQAAALARISKGRTAPKAPTRPAPPAVAKPHSIAPRDADGLRMLLGKNRITPAQYRAGEFYGTLWRTAQISGGPARVQDLSRASAGGGGDAPAGDEGAAWVADCREQLAHLNEYLAGDEDDALIAIMEMICGAGMRPREITSVQRETEQIEAALRVALDLVARRRRQRAAERAEIAA